MSGPFVEIEDNMNIHIYYNESSLILGLIRMHGNCPAEKLSLLREKLETFVLKLKADVVATTTDAITVVKKF
jgi:hypothetical protein